MRTKIEKALPFLRCPQTHVELTLKNSMLMGEGCEYKVSPDGIPKFAEQLCSEEGKIQEKHYDAVSDTYIKNLNYPHTREYLSYLDSVLVRAVKSNNLGVVGEICCGTGEAFNLFKGDVKFGIGVDVSMNMLRGANKNHEDEKLLFIQGDAVKLPLANAVFDNVFCLGGIHHVNNRIALFGEIERVLKSGGRFIWREPVDDFIIWRMIRAIIYKLSPHLDDKTEQPLRYESTKICLKEAGLKLDSWNTYGFFGFCFFMNSDVLVFNRLFKYIPKIRSIVRAFIKLDNMILNNPLMRNTGLQAVGIATKLK